MAINYGLKVFGGVFDAGYRGEYLMCIGNFGKEAYTFEKGHKVCQLLIQPVECVDVEEVNELTEAHRGDNGRGSTGK